MWTDRIESNRNDTWQNINEQRFCFSSISSIATFIFNQIELGVEDNPLKIPKKQVNST